MVDNVLAAIIMIAVVAMSVINDDIRPMLRKMNIGRHWWRVAGIAGLIALLLFA